MIFYLCNGNALRPTQADAKALDKDFAQIDIPTDKAGLMHFINGLYDQIGAAEVTADYVTEREQLPAEAPVEAENIPNGIIMAPAGDLGSPPTSGTAVLKPNYTTQTLAFQDEWENFPLGLKCHYAALALEDCRDILKDNS